MTLAHKLNTNTFEMSTCAASSADIKQREQFARNAAWYQAHAVEISSQHCGKCVCVAGEELFVADSAREALSQATAAHPEDRGRFVHYIPKRRVPRIYAN